MNCTQDLIVFMYVTIDIVWHVYTSKKNNSCIIFRKNRTNTSIFCVNKYNNNLYSYITDWPERTQEDTLLY